MQQLAAAPRWEKTSVCHAAGLQGVFYEGLNFRGQPTKVFAWIGMPDVQDETVPAMVLIHGGWGTAFADWVKLWTARGYAAIAMDLCGKIPQGNQPDWVRHGSAGPPGWGGFEQVDWPVTDQWLYHAVADVILGHSLLRSWPGVDPHRIGMTGISWGGFLTALVSGVDARFRFGAPVYGCGFIGEDSSWKDLGEFERMGSVRAAKWLRLWDPAHYLPRGTMPLLWINGTNDSAYPITSWQKSYRAGWGPRTVCLIHEMVHSHYGPGENPPGIHAFADQHLKAGHPLARAISIHRDRAHLLAEFHEGAPIIRGEILSTRDTAGWRQRKWQRSGATVSRTGKTVTINGTLPNGATAACINSIDTRQCTVSAEHLAWS